MKSIKYSVLLLGTLLMCFSEVYAQRHRISTLKSSEIDYSFYGGLWFPDANTGIAVGMDYNDSTSLILRTEDAGVTWNPVTHPCIENGVFSSFGDICFSDPLNGWVVGQKGTVLHTKDGGNTWAEQSIGNPGSLFSVFCIDTNTAWIGVLGAKIFYTSDGFDTWTQHTTGIKSLPRDIYFLNADTGFAVLGWGPDWTWSGGAIDSGGFILNTTNGGVDWTIQKHDNTIWGYRTVCFTNDTIGFVTGTEGTILCTNDGGLTWSEQISGTTKELCGMFFLNPDTGFVVGMNESGYGGIILHTTDGGETWTEQEIPTSKGLYSIYFIDENTGWAVGEWGAIISTANGGETWTEYDWDPPVNSNEKIIEPITRIYPNPADNLLTIEISNVESKGLEIEILNVTGQVIYLKEYKNINAHFVEQLDLSGYTQGIYLVKVRQDDTVYVGKVIVR